MYCGVFLRCGDGKMENNILNVYIRMNEVFTIIPARTYICAANVFIYGV